MSSPRSSWRSAIAMRGSVAGGTPESQEMNFAMGFGEGIEIAYLEFGARLVAITLTTSRIQEHAEFSLHAETGSLEDPLGPNDGVELNSEVIASAILMVEANDSALGELSNYTWMTGPRFDYLQMLGAPMLLASNPTFRVDALSSLTNVSAAFVRMWYRYVELTDNELLRLFALRR